MNGSKRLFRAWAGVAVVFLVSLAAVMTFLDGYATAARGNPDPWAIGRQEIRFAALRAELPKPSVLGYYSDVPHLGTAQTLAFFATLYNLAPHLVTESNRGVQPDLVVGNFMKQPDLEQIEKEQGLKLVKNYGGGVILFRRQKK